MHKSGHTGTFMPSYVAVRVEVSSENSTQTDTRKSVFIIIDLFSVTLASFLF